MVVVKGGEPTKIIHLSQLYHSFQHSLSHLTHCHLAEFGSDAFATLLRLHVLLQARANAHHTQHTRSVRVHHRLA